MSDFAHIRRGFDLSDADIDAAIESRETTRALLEHLAEISAPNAGCPKLLLLFAHLAASEADWIDGDLRVELVAGGDLTVFEVMTDLGGGMRERLMPPIVMKVPVDEFRRSAERLPQLIEPLVAKREQWGRLVLTTAVDEAERKRSRPPAAVAISEASLTDAARPAPLDPLPRAPIRRGGVSVVPLARSAPPAGDAARSAPAIATPGPVALRGLEGLLDVPDPPAPSGGPPGIEGIDLGWPSRPPPVAEPHFAGTDLSPEQISGDRRSSAPTLEIVDPTSSPPIAPPDPSMLGGVVEGFDEAAFDLTFDLASVPPPAPRPAAAPASPPAPTPEPESAAAEALRGLVELHIAEQSAGAQTDRGMPAAAPLRLPTEPPPSYRGYRVPAASQPAPGEVRRETKEGIPAVTSAPPGRPSAKPDWVRRVKTSPGIPEPGSLGPPPAPSAPPLDDLAALGDEATDDETTKEVEIPRAALAGRVRDDGPLPELPRALSPPPLVLPVSPPRDDFPLGVVGDGRLGIPARSWGAPAAGSTARLSVDLDDPPELPTVGPRTPGRWPGEAPTARRPIDPRREEEVASDADAHALPLVGAPPASWSTEPSSEVPTRPRIVTWNIDDNDVQPSALPVVDGRGRPPPSAPVPTRPGTPRPPAPPMEPDFPTLPLIGALPGSARAASQPRLPVDDEEPPSLPTVGGRALPAPAAARPVPELPRPRPPAFGTVGAPGAAVRHARDLFDDQEPELEVDWGEKGPPPPRRG